MSVRRHEPPSESGIHPGCFRGAGIGRVHDRYITSPRQVHDRLNQIQSLRRDTGNPSCGMTPPLAHAQIHAQRRSPRHRASLPPAAGDARSVTASPGSLDDMAQADPSASPAARTNKTSPPPVASRTAEIRPPGMHGMHQPGEQSGRPRNGTKRARIGKASGSTDRLLCPDAVRLPASPRYRKWFCDGPFTVLGRASLCSLALIAARFLRAGGRVRGREAPAQRRRRRP